MGVLGGFGAILWLLPAGTAQLTGHGGHSAQDALLHVQAPFSLSLYSAETAPTIIRDRFRFTRGGSAMLVQNLGPFSMTLSAGSARGGRPSPRRGGRLNFLTSYQIGAAIRTGLPGRFTLGGSGTLTYLRRAVGLPGFDGRARQSIIASAALSIACGPSDRLSLSYIDVASGAGRATLARTVELVAGAPRAASGFRLAFSHRIGGDGPRSLTWGIDSSVMRLSERDSLLLGEPARAVERRIAIDLDRRF